MRYPVVFLNEG